MQRYAQVIKLRPEHREEYLRLHREVWPSVEDAIVRANIRNYSIFLHGDLLIGYFEYVGEDYDADMAAIASPMPRRHPVTTARRPLRSNITRPSTGARPPRPASTTARRSGHSPTPGTGR